MKKTTKCGTTWEYPLDRKSKIKCEGFEGCYTIIDAVTYDDCIFVLLEHDFYGDETPLLLAMLPPDCLRWYVVEKDGYQIKRFFIQSEDLMNDGWDSISDALLDFYPKLDLEDIEFWTDEEIDNMEGI